MRSNHVRLQTVAVGLAVVMLVLGGCKPGGEKGGGTMPPAAQEMAAQKPAASTPEVQRGYAPVNGLKMYYEIHGTGRPLVLLHGAFMTVEAWGDILTELAKTRKIIAVELQGHGRTADIDRPFSFEQFADDVAAFMRHIGVDKADILGFSMGGGVAIQAAIRHPGMVDKLVVVSATYRTDGWYPAVMATIAQMTPDNFTGTPIRDGYDKVAPNPAAFPTLVDKIKAFEAKVYAWPEDAIRAITSPTLIVLGDSDGVRPEHAIEMFRLLGGGVFGDIAGMPRSQLAVLPGTHHFGVMFRSAWLVPMIGDFLDGIPLPSPM